MFCPSNGDLFYEIVRKRTVQECKIYSKTRLICLIFDLIVSSLSFNERNWGKGPHNSQRLLVIFAARMTWQQILFIWKLKGRVPI